MDSGHPTAVQLLRGVATPWDPERACPQDTQKAELHIEQPPQKSYQLAPQLSSPPAAWAREATWKQAGEAPPPSQKPPLCCAGGKETKLRRGGTHKASQLLRPAPERRPQNICLCNHPDTCPQESQARPQQPENQVHIHLSRCGLGAWSPPQPASWWSIAEATGPWRRRVLCGTQAGSSCSRPSASGGSSTCIWTRFVSRAQVYFCGLGFASSAWFYVCAGSPLHLGFYAWVPALRQKPIFYVSAWF